MTPVENPRVTSPYGPRKSPITSKQQNHGGQDMTDARGNLKLRSIWDTLKTDFVQGYNGGRGNTAYLYYTGTLRVLYQHLASFSAEVLAKKSLKQGASVGVMGTTGDSTGIHLHIEVQVLINGKWTPVEPSKYTEVPNTVGIHPGNNNLDSAPLPAAPSPAEPAAPPPPPAPEPAPVPETEKPMLFEYSGIVASPGDAAAIEALLKDLGIPFIKKTA